MSSLRIYKYSGAGNDFIVLADGIPSTGGTEAAVSGCALPAEAGDYRNTSAVSRICDRNSGFRAADGRIGADGLMILSLPGPASGGGQRPAVDFRMEYFNADGSGGMMCGNGGRCIAAFADFLGIRPQDGRQFVFEAPDGLHTAEILSRDGRRCTVRLKMIDAFGLRRVLGGWFLNTGTRHFVLFTDDADKIDVAGKGAELRWDPEFAPEGANVNFVSRLPDGSLKIRTFEKGVEAETLACGTGITAAAIAAWNEGIPPSERDGEMLRYRLHARTDDLAVDFSPCGEYENQPGQQSGAVATEVYLTGPAERIG